MKLRGSFLKTLESTTVVIEPTIVAIEPASHDDQSLPDSQEPIDYSPSPQITCMTNYK